MKNQITAFLKDESGQTSTEYILLVAVVAFIIFKFKSALQNALIGQDGNSGIVGKVFQQANSIADQIGQN